MGLYINPPTDSKELWLFIHAKKVAPEDFTFVTGTGLVPVVLVENDWFSAAGVCTTLAEFEQYTDTKRDHRPKTFYYAHYEAVKKVVEGQPGVEHYDISIFAEKQTQGK